MAKKKVINYARLYLKRGQVRQFKAMRRVGSGFTTGTPNSVEFSIDFSQAKLKKRESSNGQ